jgi:hypothetical protein
MPDAVPYEKTRRPITAETPIDLFFFRPAARVLAELALKAPLRSRWVLALGVFLGLAGASLFRFADRFNVIVGAALLLLYTIFSSAAVQLARARGTSSRLWRIVGGLGDYAVGLATALAIAVHLAEGGAGAVLLTALGMGSVALQVTLYDHFENRYLAHSSAQPPEESDLEETRAAVTALAAEGDAGAELALHRSLVAFLRVQRALGGPDRPAPRTAAQARDYAERLAPIAGAWAWLGSSTHVLLLSAFACFDALPWYLGLRLTVGNAALIGLWLEQHRRERAVLGEPLS